MFVMVLTSYRDGLGAALPLESVVGTVNAPWLGLVTARLSVMLPPANKSRHRGNLERGRVGAYAVGRSVRIAGVRLCDINPGSRAGQCPMDPGHRRASLVREHDVQAAAFVRIDRAVAITARDDRTCRIAGQLDDRKRNVVSVTTVITEQELVTDAVVVRRATWRTGDQSGAATDAARHCASSACQHPARAARR